MILAGVVYPTRITVWIVLVLGNAERGCGLVEGLWVPRGDLRRDYFSSSRVPVPLDPCPTV